MADKQPEKLKMKRKRSKVNSKVMNDLSLEDVVRAGGDEVSALPFLSNALRVRTLNTTHAVGIMCWPLGLTCKVNMFSKLRPNLSL